MASQFRYNIAKRVIRCLTSSNEDFAAHEFVDKLASLVRIKSHKTEKPQFMIPWDKISSQFNIESNNITNDLINNLKGNGLIWPDGIIAVDVIEEGRIPKPFLVFTVSRNSFIEETLKETYKQISNLRNVSPLLKCVAVKRNVVEYSSPNIAKPFHIGHIRSTIIGNAISNLHQYVGHDVTRINYLGDWGTQYGILTAGVEKFASSKDLKDITLEELVNIYIAANSEAENDISFFEHAKTVFNQMENGDPDLLEKWNKLRNLSIIEFDKSYKRIGVKFDETHGESMYKDKAYQIVEEMKKKNLAIMSEDGAVKMQIISGKNTEMELPLLKKDGSTLYITRDIAAAIDRKSTYNFDNMYYVVDNGQSEHFSALKQVLEKIGYPWYPCLHHIKFGRIHGLSTRKGQVVFLDQLLDTAKNLALKAMGASQNTKVDKEEDEAVADVLGVSAVIVNDLKSKRQNDYEFDWKKVLHNKGDSGIELQYNHARLSALDRAFSKALTTEFDASVLFQPEALHLVTHIAKFDEVIFVANSSLQPCVLVQYLFKLCFLIGKANAVITVKGNEKRVTEARYFLYHVSRLVLNQGMKILGLKPLEKM